MNEVDGEKPARPESAVAARELTGVPTPAPRPGSHDTLERTSRAPARGAAAAGHGPVRWLGRREYVAVWEAMRAFTETRGPSTGDECWCLEHPPVFTLGRTGGRHHVLDPGGIPVVESDRGGQVTYHGPGQLVVYPLLDLGRRRLSVRGLVDALEGAVVAVLAEAGVRAELRPRARGVYVDGRKVASLGLRVRRGRCYHGLALNVRMDLGPFARIHPCGDPALRVTQLADLGLDWSVREAARRLIARLRLDGL